MNVLTEPGRLRRRSFVYRRLAEQGARFVEIEDAALAAAVGREDVSHAAKLGLADLSPLARTGFKGRNVLASLESQGISLAPANRAVRQANGGLAAVLAPTEVLILTPIDGDGRPIRALEQAWSLDEADGCYLAPRQDSHYWFVLTGAKTSAMFAKICGVDLRLDRFPDLVIAQTSVARSSAVVIRADLGRLPAFHLLGDSASAEYIWDCLLDAMAEFEGRPVGLETLQEAARHG